MRVSRGSGKHEIRGRASREEELERVLAGSSVELGG